MLSAGRLRHRVVIEERVETQDANTGALVVTWATFADDVPAAIEPVSVREFLSARQAQSEITTMIVFRFIPGLKPTMRIRHGAVVYTVAGFLPDKVSNAEYVTAPCGDGVTVE